MALEQGERNKLLDILINQVSPSDLRIFIYKILGPGANDNLRGNAHPEKCIDFMERLDRTGQIQQLLETLAQHRHDIDLSEFGYSLTDQRITTAETGQFSSPAAFPSNSMPSNTLIVTATTVETRAVLQVFSEVSGKKWDKQTIGNKVYYNLGVYGDTSVFLVQCEMGTATPGGAIVTVRQAIQDLHPQAVIMCGIAFGLRPDKQHLGDILIAKQLQCYEPQKIDHQRGQIQRGDRVTVSDRLLAQFRSGDIDWKGPQTWFGLMLSGEKLVNASEFRDSLLQIEPEAIGGEMEGAGLYVAARDAQVDWILVKAICDWADGTKNDGVQPLAAHNAAQFVLHVLQPVAPDEEPPLEEPESTPFLPFANRKEEWERIVFYPDGQYYLFEAPAGYGKTSLLKKLMDEFTQRGWFCAYTSFETYGTLPEIVAHLAEELKIAYRYEPQDINRTGKELGIQVARNHKKEPGLALLFDIDHERRDSFEPVLKALIQELIPGIWDGLTQKSQFFKLTPRNYRVVIAGRSLSTWVTKVSPLFSDRNIIRLKPFDYEVVQDICTTLMPDYIQDIQGRDDFAAHLLFHSGGHPRCMARALELFSQSGYSPVDFWVYHREDIGELICAETAWVKRSIERDYRRIFDFLCVYRRLDISLLREFFERGLIRQGTARDELDLIKKLLASFLLDWTKDSGYKHLSDDITRRLLAIQLRLDNSDQEFRDDCYQARQFCLARLEAATELQHYWAVEVLFEYLQAHMSEVDDPGKRKALRTAFFDAEVPLVLQQMSRNLEPSLEYESFRHILADDQEFQFVVNYYLRDDRYNNDVYLKILNKIEQFSADCSIQQKGVSK